MIQTNSYKFACPFCKKKSVIWTVHEDGLDLYAMTPCCQRKVFGRNEEELESKVRGLDAGFRRQYPEELGF
jgi:hypothetical protein